jgi:uncharacterized repeat protein (TIGR03803 family)
MAASSESVLWSFGAAGDGFDPRANLIADEHGNFYRATLYGGADGNYGTVFELTPPRHGETPWKEPVLWSFEDMPDGALPTASVIANSQGELFGTTVGGGAYEAGTVFKSPPRHALPH